MSLIASKDQPARRRLEWRDYLGRDRRVRIRRAERRRLENYILREGGRLWTHSTLRELRARVRGLRAESQRFRQRRQELRGRVTYA